MENRKCIWNTTDRHCEYCTVEHCSERTNVSNSTTSCSNEVNDCISIKSDSIPNLDPDILEKYKVTPQEIMDAYADIERRRLLDNETWFQRMRRKFKTWLDKTDSEGMTNLDGICMVSFLIIGLPIAFGLIILASC